MVQVTVSTPQDRTPARGQRQAGPAQAAVLLGASCLSVLGAVLIAPVQPKIERAFAGQPGVHLLVPVTLTVPALMIALLAPFAGRIVDALGRLRLLTGALVVYAAFGTAPLWLDSLPLVVASRAGVGVAEAAIMTCCTTLLADYYSGSRRDRVLGMQVVCTSVAAVAFIGLGGLLGATSWRTPFALYAASLVFAALVPLVLRQPAGVGQLGVRSLPPVDWQRLRLPCLTTLFGGIVFYAPIVELSFKLDTLGITSTATIGAVSAMAAVATAAGAITFGRVAGRGPATLLPVAFGLAGIGLVVLGFAEAVPLVGVGAVVTSSGCGLLLPTLLTWALGTLSPEQRGRGTGLWTAGLFVGQFVCPIAILGVKAAFGSLGAALVLLGVLALLAVPLSRRAALQVRGPVRDIP